MKVAVTPGFNNLGLLFASALAFLSIILVGGSLHLVHVDHQWNWPLMEGWKSVRGFTPVLAIACFTSSVFLIIREWKIASLASLTNWLGWVTLPLMLATGFWVILPASYSGTAMWVLLLSALAGALWLANAGWTGLRGKTCRICSQGPTAG